MGDSLEEAHLSARRAPQPDWSGRDWHRSRYGSADQGLVDRLERRALRALLAPYSDLERVLDAPAGYGRLSPLLAKVAPRLVSLDLHASRLACAPRSERVLCVQGDLSALPCAPRAFDLVVCFRHLQHLSDPGEVRARLADLSEQTRRLLLVSYYTPASLHRAQRRLMVRLGRRSRELGWSTPAFMAAELGALGFEVRADRGLLPGLHAQRLLLAARA